MSLTEDLDKVTPSAALSTDPVPRIAPGTSGNYIVAAVPLDGVVYIFSQGGDIFRMQVKPLQFEHLWAGTLPVRTGVQATNTAGADIPAGVSSPSRYGGNYGIPPDNPMPTPPPVPSE